MLRVVEAEILNVLTRAGEDREQPILFRIRGRASPEKIAELRDMLREWLDSVQSCEESSDDGTDDFGGLIAFYEIE